MINNFKNKFNSFFYFIQRERVQLYLLRTNFVLSIISLIFIYLIINDSNYQIKNFKFTFDEIFLSFCLYVTNLLLWLNYMKKNYGGSSANYFYTWALSKLGKYIPSGIMILTSRLNQKLPKNKDSKNIFIGLLEEQFLLPLTGFLSSLFFLMFRVENYKLLIFFLILILTFELIRAVHNRYKSQRISYMDFRILFLLHICFNFLMFYVIIENLNLANSFEITLFYFISSCIGSLFVGIPAGIGIREVVFFFVLGSANFDLQVIDVILKIRLLVIFTDVLFYFSGLLFKKLKR